MAIYCAQLGLSWAMIVGACLAVSIRESRYPRSLKMQFNVASRAFVVCFLIGVEIENGGRKAKVSCCCLG